MSKPPPNRVFLALGSNIDAESNLPAAVNALSMYGQIVKTSSVWESAAVGFTAQANFLNAAILLETELSADDLKRQAITTIENQLGRVRDPNNRNAARTIDIDIALFNHDVVTVGSTRIPDPDILERVFLAVPLAELDAKYVHPQDGRTLLQIADSLRRSSTDLMARPDVDISL